MYLIPRKDLKLKNKKKDEENQMRESEIHGSNSDKIGQDKLSDERQSPCGKNRRKWEGEKI